MTPLHLSDTDPAELAVDAIVVGLHSTNETGGSGPLLAPGAESVAVAFEGRLAETLGLLGATGAVGQTLHELGDAEVIGPLEHAEKSLPHPSPRVMLGSTAGGRAWRQWSTSLQSGS